MAFQNRATYTFDSPLSKHDNAVLDVLAGILSNGIESGYINYWAAHKEYQWSDVDTDPRLLPEGRTFDARVFVRDADNDGGFEHLDAHDLLRAALTLINGDVEADSGGYNESLATRLATMLKYPTEDDFDAADADILIQVAVLGDVVYG